ncbi:hypothetical protein AB0942_28745 [Streptomyces nodosus]|uniref:hypothetical protein n=1 Tax=Streptomyces nodosus TaxID=40318 RepID=UPI003453584E
MADQVPAAPWWQSAVRSLHRHGLRMVAHLAARGMDALTRDSSSADDSRAVALAHAGRAGLEVAETYVDDAWKSDPVACSASARAYTSLRRGEINGLVAAARDDISPYDSVYEQKLHRLRVAGVFLDLALDETHI